MTRTRMSGLVVLAALAVSAVSAANAFAEEGYFKDGTHEPAKVNTTVTGKLKEGGVALRVKGHLSLICSSATLSGTITSQTTAEASTTFTGCEAVGTKCKSGAGAAGEIVARPKKAG